MSTNGADAFVRGVAAPNSATVSNVIKHLLHLDSLRSSQLKSSRHTTITFTAFLEAIARMSFVVDSNTHSPGLVDFADIALELERRHKRRGILIDNFQKSLVIGFRESDGGFRRNLKLVFSDEVSAQSMCAKLLQRFVRGWKGRRTAKRNSLIKTLKAGGAIR